MVGFVAPHPLVPHAAHPALWAQLKGLKGLPVLADLMVMG